MSRSRELVLLSLALFILSNLALAESSDNYTVNVTANKFLGNFLVNQSGFALYYFLDDADGNGFSTCYDGCVSTWPPFFAEKLILPDSLRFIDFSTITREDGSSQTTFKGWPLYLYSRDIADGDTFGNGQKGLWHVIDPMELPQQF
jgi:predicted lipoprotein with Yx(FWY)xxD motif